MLKTAIFIDDYLLLLDFIGKVEEEFPTLEYKIFASREFAETLEDIAYSYIETDLSLLKDFELLVFLAKPSKDHNIFKSFDGTVINGINYEFNKDVEVFKVYEPIRKILRNLAVPVSDISVVLSLPVCIYGKAGVEDLMQQTRSVFTFDSVESLIFQERIAFNKHFNYNIGDIRDIIISDTIKDFISSGGDISVRLSSLSTVFEMDVFGKDFFGLKDDNGYFPTESFFTATDVSERNDIVVITRNRGLTFVGDYERVFIEDIISKMKEVI